MAYRQQQPIPSGIFNVNNIVFDKAEVKKALNNLTDPSNAYGVLNFNPGYYDPQKDIQTKFLKVKTSFSFLPYGISAYVEKIKDKDGVFVNNPNAKPQYTMTVSFQHSADEQTQYSPEKFNAISSEQVLKLEEQIKNIDSAVMKKLLEHQEFYNFFTQTFADKLNDPDYGWDGKDPRKAFKLAGGKSSYVLPRTKKPNEERTPYPYATFKMKAIYGTNKETGEKEFYFNLNKFNEDQMLTPIDKGDYLEYFNEMKGSIATAVFKPQVWINVNSKSMGIKYLLTAVNYVPFLSNKGPRQNEVEIDNDDLELLKNIKISSQPSTSNNNEDNVQPISDNNTNQFESLEEDAVEPEEEDSEEESEDADEEEPEPEPVKKPVAKSTRGRGSSGRGKQPA